MRYFERVKQKIVVLMSTYNGENFLEEQLSTIMHQDGVDVQILVRDDGSKDNTLEILKKWQEKGVLKWYSGDNLHSAKSFMDLLANAPDSNYYAFCDQDDYWLPTKLITAISKIEGHDEPSLYSSNTNLVDADLHFIKKTNRCFSYLFGESLVTNPVTGCTAVFNKALKDLVTSYFPTYIDMHDWWIYRICKSVDGFFFFDENAYINYRQHGNNVIGGLGNKKKTREHQKQVLLGIAQANSRYNMARELMTGYSDIISKNHFTLLCKCLNYKHSILNRLSFAFDSRIIIKNKIARRNFVISVLLGKF